MPEKEEGAIILEKSVDPRARAQLLDSLGYMIKI